MIRRLIAVALTFALALAAFAIPVARLGDYLIVPLCSRLGSPELLVLEPAGNRLVLGAGVQRLQGLQPVRGVGVALGLNLEEVGVIISITHQQMGVGLHVTARPASGGAAHDDGLWRRGRARAGRRGSGAPLRRGPGGPPGGAHRADGVAPLLLDMHAFDVVAPAVPVGGLPSAWGCLSGMQ